MLPTILTVNPMARAKHQRKSHQKRRRRHAYRASRVTKNAHRRRRRHGHNPFKLSTGSISRDVTAALVGAAGAVGADVAIAYAAPYLPAALTSGWGNTLARAVAAVGVGMVAGKVAGRSTGQAVTAGGLIVVAYSALKQVLAPTLGTSIKGLSGLADFGDYSQVPYSQQNNAMLGAGMGAYMTPRMGAYMTPRMGAYMSPGSVLAPAASPIRMKQKLAGFGGLGNFGGYDSESM